MLSFKSRLIEEVSPEQEWAYLVGETKAGEESILPLLEVLLADSRLSLGLRKVLTRQLSEEAEHVELYRGLLGEKTDSTGYANKFSLFVQGLPNLTAKLFAVQTVLESISLGALEYRHQMVKHTASEDVDRIVRSDEMGHVNFGLGFIDELKRLDGVQEQEFLRSVGREANRIFSGHFNGKSIAEYCDRVYGKHVSEQLIDGSNAMKQFRKISAYISAENRVKFIQRYIGSDPCS